MKEKRGFVKKYFAVFLSLLIVLFTVLTTVSQATSISTSSANTTSAKSGDYVYYSVYNKLYRVNTKTKKKQLILYKKSWWDFNNITVYKGYIYCIAERDAGDDTYIYRVKTDGTNGKLLGKGENLVLYGGKLYYKCDTDKNKAIYRMNLDGSGKKLIKSATSIYSFEIYKSNIYYSTLYNIYKVDINGKNNKRLFYLLDEESDKAMFSIYGGNIYYNRYDYNEGVTSIYKYNLSSKKFSKVISNASGFDVSNGYIYYTTSSQNEESIYRSKISTGKKYLITKKSYIYSVHLEGDYILYKSPGPTQHENTRLSIIKCNGKENTKLADFFAS